MPAHVRQNFHLASQDMSLHSLTSASTLGKMSSERSDPFFSKIATHIDHTLISGFHPVFFSSVMGTGMLANLMYLFPFPARWLQICGLIMGVILLLLFVVLCGFFLVALVKRPTFFSEIHWEPTQAPFMGTFVMGGTSLVTLLHAITKKDWILACWVLWWVTVALSVYTGFVTFFFSFSAKTNHHPSGTKPENLLFAFVLPVVTLTVSASLGGAITQDLGNLKMEVITLAVSYLMWAVAIFLASIITVVNFWRLFIYRSPAAKAVLTMFLPIGYLGQGAYGILLFGKNCLRMATENGTTKYLTAFAQVDIPNLPQVVAVSVSICSMLAAGFLISFGFFVTFLAVSLVVSKTKPFARRQDSPPGICTGKLAGFLMFNRSFWSMTFPLGTMAQACNELYSHVSLLAFRYVAAIYAVVVILVTISCLCGICFRIFRALVRCSYSSD